MLILDSNPVTLIKRLQYRSSPGKFTTILKHSHQTFSVEPIFI